MINALKEPFDPKLITMKLSMHLNGGKAFNKSIYTIAYKGLDLGEAVTGREGKERVSLMIIDGKEFDMLNAQSKVDAVIAAKEMWLRHMEKGTPDAED